MKKNKKLLRFFVDFFLTINSISNVVLPVPDFWKHNEHDVLREMRPPPHSKAQLCSADRVVQSLEHEQLRDAGAAAATAARYTDSNNVIFISGSCTYND